MFRSFSETCNTFRPGKTIIIGHSAGGSALKSAADSGSLDIVKPHRVVLSDASYGRWADVLWRKHGSSHRNLEYIALVRYGDKPWKNIKRFLRQFYGQVPESISVHVFKGSDGHTHRSIGDMSLLWAYAPKDFRIDQ